MSNGFSDMEIEGGQGKYLKIKGEDNPADIHILSEKPVKIVIHGFGQDRVPCSGKACPHCAEGETPKQRWMINVWNRKSKTVQIYEFGASVARQIKAIAEMLQESQQTVHDIDLRVKAEGTGLETEYTVMNRPSSGIVPDDLKLYDLA